MLGKIKDRTSREERYDTGDVRVVFLGGRFWEPELSTKVTFNAKTQNPFIARTWCNLKLRLSY